MKALLAQLKPEPDPEQNAERVCTLISDNGAQDLAIFPELFLSGYSTKQMTERSLDASDPALQSIADACGRNQTAAVVGFAEAIDREAGAYGNSAACFETDGSLAAIYRKTHLFGPWENAAFCPGAELRLVRLSNVEVGPLICFDAEFPEPARELARHGADLLVTIASNMEPYGEDHLIATRARALDNRRHHLYVNRIGKESGHRFVGRSRAIAPDGSVIEELGDDEGTIELEFDPVGERPDETVDYLRLSRPDLTVSCESNSSAGVP
ncbi:MAG: carbon-nitrogen hydrolase [Thermoleophilia bacterium]|nr:carbon-nitrogen hydrolase [Thermoleophilia bacterium]